MRDRHKYIVQVLNSGSWEVWGNPEESLNRSKAKQAIKQANNNGHKIRVINCNTLDVITNEFAIWMFVA